MARSISEVIDKSSIDYWILRSIYFKTSLPKAKIEKMRSDTHLYIERLSKAGYVAPNAKGYKLTRRGLRFLRNANSGALPPIVEPREEDLMSNAIQPYVVKIGRALTDEIVQRVSLGEWP